MKRLLVLLAACGSERPASTPDSSGTDTPPDETIGQLEVQALGVQGFVMRYDGEVVMSAPLFTRQSVFEVGANIPLEADTAAIETGLAGTPMSELRAIISGHPHYDHFIDVSHIMAMAPGARTYTNLSGRHMLAALAPDRPGCTGTPSPVITRDRVIALDDEFASYVDYTNCPDQRPPGAPLEGRWLSVPGSKVRMMAFCSMHPDQIGPIHFGDGSVDQDQCELPAAAANWLEGQTLAFLVDFLDDAGEPTFRVFYQDAPTDAPLGQVPSALIAARSVDLALLCVGSNDAVENEPTAIIENINPRYVLSGHWEDFFEDAGAPPKPLPFLDVDAYVTRAEAALPGAPDRPLVENGVARQVRHVLVQPGTRFTIPERP